MYRPEHEHDSCGVGFVAQVSGRRSNRILRMGLRSICNLMHRGALDADAKTGDGAGILTQIPYKLFVPEVTPSATRCTRKAIWLSVCSLPAA